MQECYGAGHVLVKTPGEKKVVRKVGKAPEAAPVRAPLAELGTGAAWLLGMGAMNQIVAIALQSNPLATLVVQAVVVDLAVGKAGVRWDPGAGGETSVETRNAARGLGVGAGIALGVTACVIGVSAALGWAKIEAHAPNTTMALGALRAVAFGVRDTLLYAGLPVYFVGRARGAPRAAGVVFGALAAGATLALQPAATPANVVLAVAVIGAAAALWTRRGAGWEAAGLVGGWALFAGAMFRGGLFDVGWKKGALAPGFAADGPPAWLAAGLFVALALFVSRGRAAGNGAVAGAAKPVVATEQASAPTAEAEESESAGESESAAESESTKKAASGKAE